MKRSTIIALSLVVIIVGFFTYLFLVNFDRVDEEITIGYSELAQRNDFLAAERFLRKLDFAVITHREQFAVDKLLKSKQPGTLLMRYNAQIETKERFEKIMSWMKSGGHLILEINAALYPKEGTTKVGLLKEFGVSLKRNSIFFEDIDNSTTLVQIYENGDEFETDFLSVFTIDVENLKYIVKADDKNGTHLVEFKVGDGSITLLSDINIWRNRGIAEHDHAALLVEILGRSPGHIDIIAAISMPSLLELIWKNGKWFCVSLALLIAFYLWSLFEKFGPTMEKVDTSRRSLIEHLDAAAKFDWRHFRGSTLLEFARDDLGKFLDNKHPSAMQRSEKEIHQWLHEKTNIPLEDITSALTGETENATTLVHAIQTIQKIRKQL